MSLDMKPLHVADVAAVIDIIPVSLLLTLNIFHALV